MVRKIILFLFIICVAASAFAQKNKKKSPKNSPKNSYFVMLINGEEKPAASYCPGDSILFDFAVLDSTIKNYTYYWWDNFHIGIEIHNTTPIKIAFPIVSDDYKVSIKFTIPTDSVDFIETLTTDIKIDFIRTILDTTVCQGRNISVPTNTHGILTYTDVQATVETPWDTLHSVSGCDSLVRWHISMDPYITLKYKISSCDSVIWGDIVVKRPPNVEGDWETQIERMFYATDPDVSCDTLITLDVTIIDTGVLKIIFDQDVYCSNDDPQGTIELETNFTAFGWTYLDKDSMWTETEKSTDIEYAGYYRVHAYMDTSLYDTLQNLRIVNCFLEKNTLVEDCPLIIPNVITPNGDNQNEMLGIKKLNPVRENELTIYDRWGKVVFHQKNYKCIFKGSAYLNQEDAFKGISQGGQKLPEGTYYYAFKYASIPKTKKYTGTIVILR